MPTLIDRHGVRADDWRLLEGPAEEASPDDALLVPLQDWLAQADALRSRHHGRLGVLLDPADDPAALAGDLDALELVAVTFPAFTDGRGYSIARLLRERLGWKGELRAVGDVLRDQLFYMSRCGFDSFALADGESAEDALRHFGTFSEPYQAAVDRGPLFARRIPAPAGHDAATGQRWQGASQ
ncbi:DUF934 domain-containing protein [Quisquiliibacterium transsilvanicum]|uniref:Uncharacterized protein (DUF934 family) n=1 Tax=Quisquiliibacterium transsilvanicum TaxID=1549638 RepID=A0A7W8M7Z0_9BURK|nr:DUF934 domain-containing protein [Quisquiliibacterium transsilvanicum]MBB5270700.1 uncharacterized protein (DUF934 family) [Quisquiliibacterium transsilvanicum]